MVRLEGPRNRPYFVVTVARFRAVLPACVCVSYPEECPGHQPYSLREKLPRYWSAEQADQFEMVVLSMTSVDNTRQVP